jgi:hypothetical protein
VTRNSFNVRGFAGAKVHTPDEPADESIRALLRHATNLADERVVQLTAQSVVVTLNAHSDAMIPEAMREAMRQWHVVSIRRTEPGGEAELGFERALLDKAFAEFKRALEGER